MCMEEQISLFDYPQFLPKDYPQPYRITKPIRLIELFAGIGAQALSLRDIGANFERWKVVEIDPFAIKSYNAIHGTNFEPTDITKIHASDLNITDTDNYEYIMFYSFPCQDISNAGKQKSLGKGSGTRSSLLWHVQRILDECKTLPQVLIMENVKNLVSSKHKPHFDKFLEYLESKGYKNYWKIVNATEANVAQNRQRVFCISLLGNYSYEFPKPVPLTKTMKDYLEEEVDEKYYIKTQKAKELVANFIEENQNLVDRQTDRQTVDLCIEKPKTIRTANCIGTSQRGVSKRKQKENGVLCVELQED